MYTARACAEWKCTFEGGEAVPVRQRALQERRREPPLRLPALEQSQPQPFQRRRHRARHELAERVDEEESPPPRGFLIAEVACVRPCVPPDGRPRALPQQIDEIRRREQHLVAPVAREQRSRAACGRAGLQLARDAPHVVDKWCLDGGDLFFGAAYKPGERLDRKSIDLQAIPCLDLGEEMLFIGLVPIRDV